MIDSRLGNDLNGPKMLNVANSAVSVKLNNVMLPERPIIIEEAGTQQACILHNCLLVLRNIVFDEPVCTSRFCNCIDCYEGGIKRKICPCYAKTCSNHPIVAVMEFDVFPDGMDGERIPVRWFTSKSVTEFFFQGCSIASGVRASSLNRMTLRVPIRNAFARIIDYINNGGDLEGSGYGPEEVAHRSGWSITAWARRGKHKDESLRKQTEGQFKSNSAQTTTESSNLVHHIVNIEPSCVDHLSMLESLRFDSSTLVQSETQRNVRVARGVQSRTGGSDGDGGPGGAAVAPVANANYRIRDRPRQRAMARARDTAAAAARRVVDSSVERSAQSSGEEGEDV